MLHHEEARLGLGEAAPAAEHVHEGAIVAELEGHVDVVFVLETVLEADDVGVLERLVDLDFCVKLGSSSVSIYHGDEGRKRTLVLAFLLLREHLVTTLHADLCPRASLTSYTRANPP